MSKLDEALGLFPSCIKSGENWSPICQAVLDAAKQELTDLRSRLTAVKGALNAPDIWMDRVQNALAILQDDTDRAKLRALKDEFNAAIDSA